MRRGVYRNELRQRRGGVAALALGMSAMSLLTLSILGSLSGDLDQLFKELPPALLEVMGADVPGGEIVGELFNLIAPIAFVAYAITAGAGAIAGEERDGTMATLIAYPITRTRLLLDKCIALTTVLLGAAVVFAAATSLLAQLFDVPLTTSNVFATCVHLLLLAIAFGMLAICIGAATGRPEHATMISAVAAVLAYLASSMLPLANLDGWAKLSPWYYYAGSTPLTNGLAPAHLAVLATLALIFVVAGRSAFLRRDLRG